MPNWCDNSLLLTGPKDVIQEIHATGLQLKNLVPWPEELENVQKIHPIPENEVELRKKLEETYGVSTLYDWCVQNWGTKWDLDIGSIEVEDEEDGTATLRACFNSAWGPPVEAFSEVYDNYRNRGLDVELQYFEPGAAFLGVAKSDPETKTFSDEYYEYKNANELEKYARKLDNYMAESEVEYLREREEEEQPKESKTPAKKAVKSVTKKAAKAPAKKVAKKAASASAKKVATKKPAKKAAKKTATKKVAKRTTKK